MMMILVKIKIVLNRSHVIVNRSSIIWRCSSSRVGFHGGDRERGAQVAFVQVASSPAPTTVMHNVAKL
jgi:hypothetical protein